MGVGGDGAAGAELPQRDPEACGSEAVMVGTASEAWGGGRDGGRVGRSLDSAAKLVCVVPSQGYAISISLRGPDAPTSRSQ